MVAGRAERASRPPDEPIAETRAFWQRLGLPGLFDVHVHFHPPDFQRRIWAHFDEAGPKIGLEWPIRYRQSVQDRVDLLRALGVRRFSALPYAHKPGVATYLNTWARAFADEVPEVLWSGTFFPEPDAAAYVGQLVDDGVAVLKLHLQVGAFALDDPLLDEVWTRLEESGTPVVVHAGSGPVPNEFTGPAAVRRVLTRWPRLALVVAHLGAPEYDEFVSLAEQFERVHLDTTMVFTDFFEHLAPYPASLLPRLVVLQDKVLLGSDFPTIPYPYLHQLESLERLGLGEQWLRAVCWDNSARLFGTAG